MGKLNILHHKEWHVYSNDNINKVKKDESIAREKLDFEDAKQRRIDSERRIVKLRGSARSRDGKLKNESTHINLFEEEEKYQNSEMLQSEASIKLEKRKEMHTWYLGETRDGKKDHPWYATMDYGESIKNQNLEQQQKKVIREQKRKSRHDPMSIVPRDDLITKSQARPKSIEDMRKERLEREKNERVRTKEALNGNSSSKHETSSSYYHSQFNKNHVRRRD